MKVIEKLRSGKKTLSFEFFPPRTKDQEKNLFKVIDELKKFNPDFASVTYGALGTTREKSFFWVKEIKKKFSIDPVAHLTCVASLKESILEQLEELGGMGVENILALRGDPPEGQTDFAPPKDGFRYAKELIAFIKKNKPEFCLGAAGFPEGHREAPSLEKDTQYLKEKIDVGADYIITQLFFDNKYYFDLLERAQKKGINVPIIPGLMLITSIKQIRKMTEMCGATIPKDLLKKLERHEEDKEAVRQIGIEHAIAQCQELLRHGIPGLHFFVLNQSGPISRVLEQVSSFR